MRVSYHSPFILIVFIIGDTLFVFTLEELFLMMLEAIEDHLAQRNAAVDLYEFEDGSYRPASRSTELVLVA